MGLLINGQWHDQWYDTESNAGDFQREAAQLRHWVTSDGAPGPSGEGGFKAESGRYHLYVSLACPWAHRTLIMRKLKGLESHIGVSVVNPDMLDQGWTFSACSSMNAYSSMNAQGATDDSPAKDQLSVGDQLYNYEYLHQLYSANKVDYSGRVTVPVLWDKYQQRIVSNESSEIIRMFNSAFNKLTGDTQDFYPEPLRGKVDEINALVYENINNGVYRCGFATRQNAYEQAYQKLFAALDQIEELLSRQAYLAGKKITEADWRLFTTLIRFDAVYHGHFKCNKQRLEDYPNLSNYVRELYQWPGVAGTVSFDHIKRHYYYSHDMINPTRVVPVGPDIDYWRTHNRS